MSAHWGWRLIILTCRSNVSDFGHDFHAAAEDIIHGERNAYAYQCIDAVHRLCRADTLQDGLGTSRCHEQWLLAFNRGELSPSARIVTVRYLRPQRMQQLHIRQRLSVVRAHDADS